MVVVYQEAYLDFQRLYDQTAQTLTIEKESPEYLWLWHHVGLTDIGTFERFMLTKTDIIPEMMKRNVISDVWLTGENGFELTEDVANYSKSLLNHAKQSLQALC